MTPTSNEPTDQAQAIMERMLALVKECRVVLRALEQPAESGESSSAEAERILYHTLMSAIDAGLIKAMEDALKVLRHASQPLGPMGAEWLERQVAAVYPELVTRTATGEVQTMKYQELIPMLLNELQRQRQELAGLRALVGQGREAAQ